MEAAPRQDLNHTNMRTLITSLGMYSLHKHERKDMTKKKRKKKRTPWETPLRFCSYRYNSDCLFFFSSCTTCTITVMTSRNKHETLSPSLTQGQVYSRKSVAFNHQWRTTETSSNGCTFQTNVRPHAVDDRAFGECCRAREQDYFFVHGAIGHCAPVFQEEPIRTSSAVSDYSELHSAKRAMHTEKCHYHTRHISAQSCNWRLGLHCRKWSCSLYVGQSCTSQPHMQEARKFTTWEKKKSHAGKCYIDKCAHAWVLKWTNIYNASTSKTVKLAKTHKLQFS